MCRLRRHIEEVQQQLGIGEPVVRLVTRPGARLGVVLIHAAAAVHHLFDVVGPARNVTSGRSRMGLPILRRPVHLRAGSLRRPLVERVCGVSGEGVCWGAFADRVGDSRGRHRWVRGMARELDVGWNRMLRYDGGIRKRLDGRAARQRELRRSVCGARRLLVRHRGRRLLAGDARAFPERECTGFSFIGLSTGV
jgi:hypothetical protein